MFLCLFVGGVLFGLAVGIINRREGRFPLVKRYGKEDYRICGGEDRGVRYITFRHVMMLDWDVPDVSHKAGECVTIKEKGEALDILRAYCMEDKKIVFRVYETPGGVRAFVTSKCFDGIEKQLMEALKCDPLYTQFCVQRREWSCRVSPKKGRENDYVARYWVTIGEGQEDEGAVELVRYHDELITRGLTE